MKVGTSIVAAVMALTLTSSGSQAAQLESRTSVARDCQGAGAASKATDTDTWRSPARGFMTADLSGGRRGDWDLAAFGSGGKLLGASTAFGSDERVVLLVKSGQRVTLRGCRRDGGRQRVPLDVSFQRLGPLEAAEPVSLVEVATSGPDDVERFERLGFDVTHDVDADSATLALYSRAERLRLQSLGYGVTTIVPDLAAADAADRQAEARVARRGATTLPSGRTTYRQYLDYTNDLKDLTDNYPAITRPVAAGMSLEGRPIQGIEIAGDVNATGDGRPVYLQVGLHHAREWPSGELPMELAIDLVENYGTSTRITDLLDSVRVIVIPVVNVDGFIASRSFGTSAADDDQLATLSQSAAGTGAYRRKNCRPSSPTDALINCAMRTSGVDLNRNYGAYWGGPGSSNSPGSQSYRGPAPYSEPESQAILELSRKLHPTVLIANHTFTDDGKWLRQPGFDGAFFPQDEIGATTPDEEAMKSLGDSMAAATGWTSERSYETLGDITGATEDWNYLAQGTYGYTPEVRGLNFHANYADSVVGEYVGEGPNAGEGTRKAYLIAGDVAADAGEHSVVEGSAPTGAVLRLEKSFDLPLHPSQGANASIPTELETSLEVDGGEYEWHVNPSGRPLVQGEVWTMSCEIGGGQPVTTEVFVARGERVTVDWEAGCDVEGSGPGPLTCKGEVATVVGTLGSDKGAGAIIGTSGHDVIAARRGDDVVRGLGGKDFICGSGGADKLLGDDGRDTLRGGPGRDRCPDQGRSEDVKSCSKN